MNNLIPDDTEHDIDVTFKVDPISGLMGATLVILVLVIYHKFIK